jgi:uncharacterized protein YggE
MTCTTIRFVGLQAFACLLLFAGVASAQYGGSRAGVDGGGVGPAELPQLDPRVAESHIAIDGRAEIRIVPTEVRMVLAVTSEGATAQDCQKQIDETIDNLKAEWKKLKIADRNIVIDFIAVLPRYEWTIEERGGVDVGVEKKAGYRMQTNLHLAIKSDEEAEAALQPAFAIGVTDIIAFDYWSKDLDAAKVKVREQALEAATSKATTLLALFRAEPPVINVQEQTRVFYPESLYHSFTNSQDEAIVNPTRRDIPFIRAHRPQNTYYRGLHFEGDKRPSELALRPEISVVSTVRVYYESPAAKNRQDDDKD